MIVIKHTINIDKKERVKYPAIWGNEVVDLDENISFYEIVENEKPTYDINQFYLEEEISLTDTVGKNKLKLAEINYNVIEKSLAHIINYLNITLGAYLDSQYPNYLRIKHLKEATIFEIRIGTDNLSEEEQSRYDYINALDTWIGKCRSERDNYEQEYKDTGKLPFLLWSTKPEKL